MLDIGRCDSLCKCTAHTSLQLPNQLSITFVTYADDAGHSLIGMRLGTIIETCHIVVYAMKLRTYLVLFSLVALVGCAEPAMAQEKSSTPPPMLQGAT